jgi:beta-glucosidase-like glycosyl hydrolase
MLLLYKLQGFVISDWQGIDKITYPIHSNYSYSVLAGIRAGIDMVIITGYASIHISHLENQ